MHVRKTRILMTTMVLIALASQFNPSYGQAPSNGFYNNQLPGAQGVVEDESFPSDKKPKSTNTTSSPPGGDYTEDEKRMQRKFKGRVTHDKDLVSRGEHMMKGANKNSKDYKKGKILKEIGEKDLQEMEANNPFPKQEKPAKADAKPAEKKEL